MTLAVLWMLIKQIFKWERGRGWQHTVRCYWNNARNFIASIFHIDKMSVVARFVVLVFFIVDLYRKKSLWRRMNFYDELNDVVKHMNAIVCKRKRIISWHAIQKTRRSYTATLPLILNVFEDEDTYVWRQHSTYAKSVLFRFRFRFRQFVFLLHFPIYLDA